MPGRGPLRMPGGPAGGRLDTRAAPTVRHREEDEMPEYQGRLTIDATPDELFEFLSRVENLPKYFSRMTEARSATGDEVHVTAELPAEATDGSGPQKVESDATFSVDADNRAITWGSENEHHYHGELQVT